VVGDIPEPVTVRAPVGLSFGDLLRSLGLVPEEIGHVMIGGVMMGRLMESLDEVVTRTTGGLLCFPEGHVVPRRYGTKDVHRAAIGKSACDQCSFCTELCPRYLLGHPVEPHIAMRSLEFNEMGMDPILGSQFCSDCNLCTLIACPEDLFPSTACLDNKQQMRAQGLQHASTGVTVPAHSMQEYRRVPISRVIQKLGLADFRNVGPLIEVDWRARELRIPLQQHIGAAAEACVTVGERVEVGQTIGRAPTGSLGVDIHASVSGTVASVGTEVQIRVETT